MVGGGGGCNDDFRDRSSTVSIKEYIIVLCCRNKGIHAVLGAAHVRLLLGVQHHRPAQHADRHDVQLLPVHLCE